MPPLRTGRNDAEAKGYIYENFGALAGFINDPEIGPLLLEAGYNKWDMSRLQSALWSTNWWRTHNESQRAFRMAQETDPATLQQKIAEKRTTINDWAKQMGLGGADIDAIARNALEWGWSDGQVRDYMATFIDASALSGANQVHTIVDRARSLAGDYFVRTTDDEAVGLARRVMAGELSPEDMETVYKDRAKELYSYLAPVLDQGMTMKQYFEPHRQQLAKLLELSPDSIDFVNDERWSKVMQIQNEDGTVRAMNLTEVADFARGQDDWSHTANAQEAASDMALNLAKTFGAM